MKHRALQIIFALSFLAVSCLEEMNDSLPVVDGDVMLSIGTPEVKTTLDPSTLQITWNKGDQITVWASGTDKSITLTSQSSGSQGNFVGDRGDLDLTKDLYAVYPSASVKMQTSEYTGYIISNPSEQSGLLSDFSKYNVSYSTALTKEVDGEKVMLSYGDRLSNMFSVIKFKIKETLDVQSIRLQGFDDEGNQVPLAGSFDFNPEGQAIHPVDAENEIIIAREGGITGEVYIFVAPDAVDKELVNSASKLRFTFTNTAGQVCEYTNYLTSKLTAGVMTNLGSINTIRYRESGQYVVSGGENWAKLNQKKDIIEGSALDFSAFSVDAPAGKYGALKAVGTHFEFAQLPGAEQYFYGANLTTSACAPEKTKSDMVAARMARIGYNTVRLHHYDDLWAANENDSNGDSFRDRMDYFVSNAINRGLYFTIDLYSARKIPSENLGLGSGEVISGHIYKVLALASAALADDSEAEKAGHLGVYKDWCGFADSVLDHKNPYTGRKYCEEPALIMVAVINEPSHSNAWNSKVYNYDLIKYAWKKCHGDFIGSIFSPSSSSVGSDLWEKFVKWVQTNGYANMAKYCKDKGSQSLMTVAFDSRAYISNSSGLSSLDVQDSHCYVDHPSGDLPNRLMDGEHPLSGLPPYADVNAEKYKTLYNVRKNVPMTITEWNHCTPNSLRGLGAIMGSAYLRSVGWDAVWRFAYAQGANNLFNETTPNSFDVSKDEVMKASEAAVVSLFLREDVTDPSSQVSYSQTEFTVITERSVALYKEDMGEKTAGILTADTRIYPATVFATSMDGNALSESSKILLANITDCAGNGATYTDETKVTTVTYGTGQMIRISESDISLALADPTLYKVYELNTDGSRRAELPVTVKDGKLCFTISVRGTDGMAHLYYEIVR